MLHTFRDWCENMHNLVPSIFNVVFDSSSGFLSLSKDNDEGQRLSALVWDALRIRLSRDIVQRFKSVLAPNRG